MDLKLLDLRVDMSDEELVLLVRRSHPLVVDSKAGFVATINGYNDDPRELWEIPEVITFLRRVVEKSAILSVLEVSTALAALKDRPGWGIGLGGFELWMISLGKGTVPETVERETFAEFLKVLDQSNERAGRIVERPGDLGKADGQRRLKHRPQ